jgi:hypothetical protein
MQIPSGSEGPTFRRDQSQRKMLDARIFEAFEVDESGMYGS